MKLTIYWKTKNAQCIKHIRKRFNLSSGITVNGETVADIRDEDMELLRETEKIGFIQIRYKPL